MLPFQSSAPRLSNQPWILLEEVGLSMTLRLTLAVLFGLWRAVSLDTCSPTSAIYSCDCVPRDMAFRCKIHARKVFRERWRAVEVGGGREFLGFLPAEKWISPVLLPLLPSFSTSYLPFVHATSQDPQAFATRKQPFRPPGSAGPATCSRSTRGMNCSEKYRPQHTQARICVATSIRSPVQTPETPRPLV